MDHELFRKKKVSSAVFPSARIHLEKKRKALLLSLFFGVAFYLFLSQLQTVQLGKTSMEAYLLADCHRNCQLVAQLASVASCMGETCRKLKCKASGGVGKPHGGRRAWQIKSCKWEQTEQAYWAW